MKTLFNQKDNTAKVLSNAAMKQVLGGIEEDKSPENGGCRFRCSGWRPNVYRGIDSCLYASGSCNGDSLAECICD